MPVIVRVEVEQHEGRFAPVDDQIFFIVDIGRLIAKYAALRPLFFMIVHADICHAPRRPKSFH